MAAAFDGEVATRTGFVHLHYCCPADKGWRAIFFPVNFLTASRTQNSRWILGRIDRSNRKKKAKIGIMRIF